MSDIVIESKGICLDYPIQTGSVNAIKNILKGGLKALKGKYFRALNDISIKVSKGEVVGIIGSNGAGKSTLLKVLGGVYHPDSGLLRTRGKIAFLATFGIGFSKDLTGRENIRLSAGFLGMLDSEIEEKMDEIIEFAELIDFIDSPLRTYSSGMRSRLGFSIACSIEPSILLLDEVFTVGDHKFRKKSQQKIKDLISSDCTVLMVSHSLDIVREMCDRVIVLEKGEIIHDGDHELAFNLYKGD
jgi:ABC-type polysaccharide/polyol phosphate transport system ATPase subunit